jgi:hypothetical protein
MNELIEPTLMMDPLLFAFISGITCLAMNA